MGYIVKKGSGKKPYRIINQKTGQVVGTSGSLAKAHRSIGYRADAESGAKDIKTYKRKTDNKMRVYGETDYAKKTVRINKKKAKGLPGEILDTIVHEKAHIVHPKMKEKNIRKHTAKLIKKMGKKIKAKHYGLFNA